MGLRRLDQTHPLSLRDIDTRLPKAMQVYDLLRNAIISARLEPGQVVIEKELGALLEMSRTPIREAVLQLAAESLIVIVPSGGTYVSRVVMQDVLAGQLVRDTIEMRLLRLAAHRHTPDFDHEIELNLFQQKKAAERRDPEEFFRLDIGFHKLICEHSGFPGVWNTIQRATGQLDRVRGLAFKIEQHYEEVLEEHEKIFQCILSGDAEGAARIFQVQLDSTFPSLEKLRLTMPSILADSGSEMLENPLQLIGRF